MTKSILKTVAGGIFIGAALFFIPKFLLGILVLMTIFRFIFWRRMGRGGYGQHKFAMADKIRSMSEEEYQGFKNNFNSGCCHGTNNCNETKK